MIAMVAMLGADWKQQKDLDMKEPFIIFSILQ